MWLSPECNHPPGRNSFETTLEAGTRTFAQIPDPLATEVCDNSILSLAATISQTQSTGQQEATNVAPGLTTIGARTLRTEQRGIATNGARGIATVTLRIRAEPATRFSGSNPCVSVEKVHGIVDLLGRRPSLSVWWRAIASRHQKPLHLRTNLLHRSVF